MRSRVTMPLRRLREKMPKFYNGDIKEAQYWARATGHRRWPLFNLVPYFDDSTIVVHLKIKGLTEKWTTGLIFLQQGKSKQFKESNQKQNFDPDNDFPPSFHIEGDKFEDDIGRPLKVLKPFKYENPLDIPIGKWTLFLMLQKKNEPNGSAIPSTLEQSEVCPIAYLNVIDGGEWWTGKAIQVVTFLIAVAALIIGIVK